jgi:hypothetical protein
MDGLREEDSSDEPSDCAVQSIKKMFCTDGWTDAAPKANHKHN